MQTYTGRCVNPLALRVEDIDIRDIAHALACVNRFNGHARAPISVAQHSVHVCQLVERPHRRQALLHDAAEAYLGDVTKWLKATDCMAGYREAEARAWAVIAAAFDVPEGLDASVVEADKFMVRFEATHSYDEWRSGSPDYRPVDAVERRRLGHWSPWEWQAAERVFLSQYECVRAR